MRTNDEYGQFNATLASTVKTIGDRIRIGAFSTVEDYVLLDCGSSGSSEISIGNRCKIKQGAVLRTYDGHIRIGNRVSVGEYSILAGHGGLTIGDCTLIAGHCYISAANHISSGRDMIRFQGESARGIVIGNNVWIGGHVLIRDGVSIGDGGVIGAGSIVTADLPSDVVCYGVPCRVV